MYVINSHRKKEPFNELTINTELDGSGPGAFILPLNLIDYVEVDWGDGTVEHFSTGGDKMHLYYIPGIYTIKMYGTGAQMFRFNSMEDSQRVISGAIGNTGWTTFNSTFYGCDSLTTLDVSTWDMSAVTSFSSAFSDCSSLTTLDVSNWDVSAVTTFTYAFENCDSLTTLDVSNWDVSAVTNFGGAFANCGSLTTLDVSNWDVSAVTNFSSAFESCSSLTTLDVSGWDVSAVTTFADAFNSCDSLTTLDVSTWDVSAVTSFRFTFGGCSSLTALDVSNWDVSAVTTFQSFVEDCNSLASLDASAWVMSSNLLPNGCNGTFRGCGTLDLKIGAGWNFSALTNASSFLAGTNIGSANYDNMLSIIASQTLNNNVIFGGGNSKYTAAGKVHRDAITASNGWIFVDGGLEA